MKYNNLSLISAGIILLDIFLYIILLELDSKNIHFQNFDGFIVIAFILPFIAFVSGITALVIIRRTREKGKSIAQLAILPFVIVIIFAYLNLFNHEGRKPVQVPMSSSNFSN